MTNDLSELIQRFLEHLEIERNCSSLTVRNYDHYLKELTKFLNDSGRQPALVTDIDQEIVRRFRLYLARKKGRWGEMKISTQGYYVIALRSFLKWLTRVDASPLEPEKIDVPKQKDHSLKFLSALQMERLLAQPLMSTEVGLRDKALMELMFSTGLRVSELVALDREKIDLKTREFGIIGKGGRSRVVFISKRAAQYLQKYLDKRKDHYPPLFIRYSGKKDVATSGESMRLSARSVQRLVTKYVRAARLPVSATPHTLRHSMATDLLQSGADLRSVQEILGHKNIATTQIYTHVTDQRLREVHEKYHQGNR